ncbi:MAG: hypothetical protein ACHQ4G_06920 [Opitutales bacterium]
MVGAVRSTGAAAGVASGVIGARVSGELSACARRRLGTAPRNRQLTLELVDLAFQLVDLVEHVQPVRLALERVRRQRPRKLALCALHQPTHLRGLGRIRQALEVLAKMVDRRDGILHLLEIENSHLEMGLGSRVTALVDDPQIRRQRPLVLPLFDQALAEAVVRLVDLRALQRVATAFAPGEKGQADDGKQPGDMQTFWHLAGK